MIAFSGQIQRETLFILWLLECMEAAQPFCWEFWVGTSVRRDPVLVKFPPAVALMFSKWPHHHCFSSTPSEAGLQSVQ